MYGLFPALMETERLQDARRQREVENATRQQEMGMRQRQLSMQEATHQQQMQEAAARQRQQAALEQAQQGVTGLMKREADNAQFQASGLPGPVMPVNEREVNNAHMGLASAKGDFRGVQDLRKQNRMLDVADEAKRMSADPEFQGKVMDYISTKEIFPLKVVPGQVDPKTGRMKTADRLEFDSGFKYELKAGDRQRIALGAAMMKNGMNEEGLKVIEGVNKELRDAVDKANGRTVSTSDFNSKADDRLADNEARAGQIAGQQAHWKAMEARAGGGGGGGGKQLPPEVLKELSALEQQYIQADPKDRPAIERQYQMTLSRAGAAVGRPMGLPSKGPQAPPETKVNPDGSVVHNGMLYLPDPKKPGSFVPAKGLGPSALDKALAGYQAGGAPPAAPAAPAPQRPPGAGANYGVYGTPGYDQYMKDMALQQFLQSQAPGALGLRTPMRPVDFTRYNTGR